MTEVRQGKRVDRFVLVVGLVVSSMVVALYTEMFYDVAKAERTGMRTGIFYNQFTPHYLLRSCIFFLLTLLVLFLLLVPGRRLLGLIHRYRWLLAFLLIALLTVCRISGSSVAYMANYVGGKPFQGTLLGIPRAIRSDEWNVFTPFAFSQAHSGYAPISDIPRAMPTDVTVVYAQPAWALATVFRPFLWGFLFLGSEMGLAFFWSARLVLLLLVSYEFGRWFTHDDRWLSAVYGLLIGFAPIVQWWFAVNGTAELFIFGQAAVLLFSRYLVIDATHRRWLVAFVIAYCLGGFIMVLYPASQIPLIYAFGAVCLWILIHYCLGQRAALDRGGADSRSFFAQAAPLISALVLVGIGMLGALYQARDAIRLESSTVYPGNRLSTGGGIFSSLMGYGGSIFSPLEVEKVLPNAPEQSLFFSLFPVGIILALYTVWRTRDGMLTALLAVDVFLYIYGIWGLPPWLCQLTLMSRATSGRLKLAIGMVELILIFRSVTDLRLARHRALFEETETGTTEVVGGGRIGKTILSRQISGIVFCLVVALLITAGAGITSTYRLRLLYLVMLALIIFFMLIGLWGVIFNRNWARQILASSIVVIVLAGCCVNPVQYGARTLTDIPLISKVQSKTVIHGSGGREKVAVLADNSVVGQALIANGVPTVNSLNAIPALDRWHRIDPDARNEWIYNRYAYIDTEVTGRKTSTFELIGADHFGVRLAVNDLPKIGVTHVLTRKDLDSLGTSSVGLERLARVDGWNLYKVKQGKIAD